MPRTTCSSQPAVLRWGPCGNCNNPAEQALFLNPMGPCEPPVCGDCHKELAAHQQERKR